MQIGVDQRFQLRLAMFRQAGQPRLQFAELVAGAADRLFQPVGLGGHGGDGNDLPHDDEFGLARFMHRADADAGGDGLAVKALLEVGLDA